jgi:transposase-like protein
MSPRKLTDEDKQEILKLYRETEETTSTLADRFGVSSSTISRFLKNHLSEMEYEDLIQQKRLARTPGKYTNLPSLPLADKPAPPVTLNSARTATASDETKIELSQSPEAIELEEAEETAPNATPGIIQPPKLVSETTKESFASEDKTAVLQEWTISAQKAEELFGKETVAEVSEVAALQSFVGEDLVDLEEEDDYEEWDDEDDDVAEENYTPSVSSAIKIQVLPLSAAHLPKTCYLVIDRAAELIVRPLKDFADLGKIPPEEFQQKTLPIFDNHRVARRFSNRSQRVIKIPDSRILQKTRTYLYAKGITRLLLDGQIYSLSSGY